MCTEVIEYSRDAPFSPNAVVTIRTLGQEKRQFLISDMMRMSVAQHRQTYKVGYSRLVVGFNADWPVKRVRWAVSDLQAGTAWVPAVAAASQIVCLEVPSGERFLLGT